MTKVEKMIFCVINLSNSILHSNFLFPILNTAEKEKEY
jgi:hypothetical protein